ncbi:MAG: ABC transporter permease [Acidobacteriia bacterium]|nr:ABC transporter permease [Terriglobia bacterium]
MTAAREAWVRLVAFLRKSKLEREFDEELKAHVEQAAEDYTRRGTNPVEARRRALIDLGGMEATKQLCRESRGLPWLDGAAHDVLYALRGLRRTPGFTLTAITTLAIGIGVNTAIFTVSKAALFSGFPLVKENNRLVYIAMSRGCCVSYADFVDWRAQAKSFERMAIVHGGLRSLSDENGFAETYDVSEVSADTFKVVGQKPFRGRDFTPSDEMPGASPVVILTYEFWRRRFAADPGIVGRTIRINSAPVIVIGVMPQGFSFPQRQDLWVPLIQTSEVMKRENRDQWFVVARLTDTAAVRTAQTEMDVIGRRLGIAHPSTNRGRNLLPMVQTFREFFILQNETPVYWTMWCAVGFVLLIACANLANLMLARAIGRSREMSVRIALGAGRWRILRERLIESLMLSGAGGVLGWWIAQRSVAVYALADRGPGRSSWRILDYSMDYSVLYYVVGISIGTALLFGFLPALRLSRIDVANALRDGGRAVTIGRRGKRLSTLLVTVEMALAVVLLAGAGVMIHSFLNQYKADVGVKTPNLTTISVSLPRTKYANPEAYISFYDRVTARLEEVPGVDSVALTSALPALGAARLPYELSGSTLASEEEQQRPTLFMLTIGPNYFRTLGTALLAGRDFNDTDTSSTGPVAIVNRRFAAKSWPRENPIGKRLRVFDGKQADAWRIVIGVGPDIAARNTGANEVDPLIYLPYKQRPAPNMELIARTRVPPQTLDLAFRHEVQKVDSGLPIFGPFTLTRRWESIYYSSGLFSILFSLFAGIALLLASMGLYAVIAYSVRHRTQEIGVRLALGATSADIAVLILQQALVPLGIGLVIGLAGSFGLNRVLKAELVNVSPSDPVTVALSSAVLICAALLGCWLPARRAMRVDPVVALRYE